MFSLQQSITMYSAAVTEELKPYLSLYLEVLCESPICGRGVRIEVRRGEP